MKARAPIRTSEIRLSRPEAWLLQVLAELRSPLGTFRSADHKYLGELFNHASHGVSQEEFERTLLRLVRRGWLAAKDRRGRTLGPAEVRADLRGAGDGVLGITPAGGAAWEAWTQPDWSRWVDATEIDDVCVITCVSRSWAERYVERVHGREAGSVRWRKVRSWKPDRYGWKRFPVAWRARFPAPDDFGDLAQAFWFDRAWFAPRF